MNFINLYTLYINNKSIYTKYVPVAPPSVAACPRQLSCLFGRKSNAVDTHAGEFVDESARPCHHIGTHASHAHEPARLERDSST
jgi:hypothetical protein